jgi:hypothetical protein
MAKALKNEVVLDFLENLKMGERVIQEIKNKKKEKDMEDEKIEISVPKGYELKQNGLDIKFVKKPDSRSLKWEDKQTKLIGSYIGANSMINHTNSLDGSSIRKTSNRNVFKTASQAIGSISLAVLTQQLADFNGDWKPDWTDDEELKYCISREFNDNGGYSFEIKANYFWFRFLALKNQKDAEEFLKANIDEIEAAKDFI